MIGAKAGAAGAKLSCRQSTKRKPATKCVRGGIAGVCGAGDGGSGVGGDGMANRKFIGVRESSRIVEIKKYQGGRNFYKTVKEPDLVAAIIHDLARVHENPSCVEDGLNIRKVERRITKEAQIVNIPIGKCFLDKYTKQHPLKLDEFPDEPNPLKLEGLTDPQFEVLKEQVVKQGRPCYLELVELKKEITRNHERHVQGRQRKDLDTIQPYLAVDDIPQEDDGIQALEDQLAEVVAKFAPSNGKLMDAKGEATKSAYITLLKGHLQKLEPAQNQREGLPDLDDLEGLPGLEDWDDLEGLPDLEDLELFVNPHVPWV